jgi:hypothetical protein
MSDTAQAEAPGSSREDRIARYLVTGGLLLVLAAPSVLVLPGAGSHGALSWVVAVALGLCLFTAAVLQMPAASTAVADIARRVERSHYPAESPGVAPPLWQRAVEGARTALLALAAYLCTLPLLLFAGIGAAMFFIATAWLLGREYWLPNSATTVNLILGVLNVVANAVISLLNLVASTNLGEVALAVPPEAQIYIAAIGGFYGLVFLLAGALGGPASPREYFGGATLVALAILAYTASRDLPGMSGFKFGPGTTPHGFSALLGALGLAVAATGVFAKGPGIERFHLRGPLFVTLSVLIFAGTVRSFGLAVSSFLSICAAAAATPDENVSLYVSRPVVFVLRFVGRIWAALVANPAREMTAAGSSVDTLYGTEILVARVLETIAWAVVLTAFCCLLFLHPYLLGLPIPLWPISDDPLVLLKNIGFQ